MEKPTDALVRRGISYIEVRALDVNPFSAIGISQTQFDFLDVFLVACLLMPSAELDEAQLKEAKENMNKVVLEGRNPDLLLQNGGENISLPSWCDSLFMSFEQAADLLDLANDSSGYTQGVYVDDVIVGVGGVCRSG
jgi:glutamate--cysteine ligase